MEVVFNNISVWNMFYKTADAYPNKEAVYDLVRRMNYEELKREVELTAVLLHSLGVSSGDKVAVALPNWHETITIYLATARLGAVLVPFNPKYRLHEMKHILSNSGAKLVFVCKEFENLDYEIVKPLVQEVITVRYTKPGCHSLEILKKTVVSTDLPAVTLNAREDVFCILYTSGTTGMPKGALITHQAMVQSGITISKHLRCTDQDIFLVLAPVFHVFGLACNLLSALYTGSKIVLLDKFKAQKALELIEQERVTIQHAVPSMLNLELTEPKLNSYDLSSLRAGMTGASPCSPEMIHAVKRELGMVLSISYGATETSTVTITEYDDTDEHIYETIGKPVEGAEVKIVNERRKEVKVGEVGEIACRGYGVMKGYYQLPEKNKEVFDAEGWFYTGDLGSIDSEGYVRYVGRKKELIIRGGYNIYPQEIEGLLQNHPKVHESAVLGLPDPSMGEITCAVVKLRPKESAVPEEIIDYLKKLIAPYKLPSQVIFMDELPLTASGKIQKVRLRELILNSQA